MSLQDARLRSLVEADLAAHEHTDKHEINWTAIAGESFGFMKDTNTSTCSSLSLLHT